METRTKDLVRTTDPILVGYKSKPKKRKTPEPRRTEVNQRKRNLFTGFTEEDEIINLKTS